jgi:sugar phosphate isomerase/epimerase
MLRNFARIDKHVAEFEAIRGWASTGAAREKYLQDLDTVARMAEAFGPAHHTQVIGPFEGDLDNAVRGFAALCDRLAQYGMRAAIEYLPHMSNIPDAAAAWRIAERAGRANGGVCVDTWHHFRSGEGFERLAQVPGERVFSVQINDGPRRPTVADYYTDCTTYRRLPGDGEFDLVGFERTLRAMGVDVPYSVEVISAELDRLPAAEAARRMAERTREVLDLRDATT